MPLEGLTEEQRTAVHTFDRPVRVIAGAGSGKTRVLVARYLALLDRGLKPSEILAVTFTRKAAREMKERLGDRVSQGARIGTVHSYCQEFLGYVTVLDELEVATRFEAAVRAWRDALSANDRDRLLRHFNYRELGEFARACYRSRHRLRPDPEAPEAGLLLEIVQPCLKKMRELTVDKGEYAYDDLEHFTRTGLLTRGDAERLRTKAVLVDEFQDTSPDQWAIFQALCEDSTEKLFVVGDPKQAIYGFRDAGSTLFDTGGVEITLSTNFRTAPALLAQVNRYAELALGDAFVPMRAGREGNGGECRVIRFAAGTEAQQIAHDLAARRLEGVAILTRSAEPMADLARALSELGIRSRVDRSKRLMDLDEMRDLLFLLETISDPANRLAAASFRASPLYTGEWIHSLSGKAAQEVIREVLSRSRPLETEAWLAAWEALEGKSIAEAILAMKAWKEEGLRIPGEEDSAWDPSIVRLLTVHGAKGLEFDHVYLADLCRQPPSPSPLLLAGAVTGLKYRVSGEFQPTPAYAAQRERLLSRERDENRRVLYVALTRARETLTLALPEPGIRPPKASWAALLSP